MWFPLLDCANPTTKYSYCSQRAYLGVSTLYSGSTCPISGTVRYVRDMLARLAGRDVQLDDPQMDLAAPYPTEAGGNERVL